MFFEAKWDHIWLEIGQQRGERGEKNKEMKYSGAFLDNFGTMLRLFWGTRVRASLGSFLGPFWEHFGIDLGSILGALWEYFGGSKTRSEMKNIVFQELMVPPKENHQF